MQKLLALIVIFMGISIIMEEYHNKEKSTEESACERAGGYVGHTLLGEVDCYESIKKH